MEACEQLERCGFFRKYKESNELACLGFIRQYCKGVKMSKCKRKYFFENNSHPPSDNMLPNGALLKETGEYANRAK